MASTLSPTSQIWAKQIRREHGFVHKEVQDLKATASNHNDRITAVENAVKANSGGDSNVVAALAKQVRELNSDGITDRINAMERDVKERLDDIDADNYTMTKVIEGFERDKQVAEAERKTTLTKDKALLKRIGEVEEELKKYQKNLDLIGKKVNGSRLDQIKEQLDGLTKQVMEEGEQMTLLTESVAKLETANTALVKANEKLEAQLKKSDERLLKQEARAGAEAKMTPHADTPASPDESTSQRKKSHKWAGGGADKDIIRQGEDLFGFKPAPNLPAPKPRSTESKKPAPQVPKKKTTPKKNPIVPKPTSDGSKRKSHKWAGGGADRDIIAAGLTLGPRRGYKRPSADTNLSSQPRETPKEIVNGKEKEVVRKGRGWFEVEESPEPEGESQASNVPVLKEPKSRPKKPPLLDENGTPIKRPRGRPRKYPRPEESQTQSVPESAGSSLGPAPTAPTVSHTKKRTADEAFEFTIPDAPDAKKSKKAAGNDSEAQAMPARSSSPRRINYAVHEPGHTANAVPSTMERPAPQPGRRRLVQLSDDFDTIIRRMNE